MTTPSISSESTCAPRIPLIGETAQDPIKFPNDYIVKIVALY